MDFNPRALHACLLLAGDPHFTRVAERLHVSGPALSQQIRRLEAQLGVRLFNRTTRTVTLTPEGEAFVPLARAALDANENIQRWAESLSLRRRRILRVGFMSTGAGSRMPDLIRAADAGLPEATIQLRHLEWGEQISAVLNADVDVAFVRDPDPPSALHSTLLFEEQRVVVLPVGHPLAGRAQVSFKEISDEVFLPSKTGPQRWINYWLVNPRPNGVPPRLGPPIATVEEMLEHCAAGRGIALSSESLIGYYAHPRVRFVTVIDLPLTPVWVCTRSDNDDPLVRRFERIVTGAVGPAYSR